ncbi:MAG TPA: hypothetical protein VK357_13010 [Rubrobacteraceae bacterium]|nr:hypothetical protein [Rubrobacteraceae bacterium]
MGEEAREGGEVQTRHRLRQALVVLGQSRRPFERISNIEVDEDCGRCPARTRVARRPA